MTIETQDDVVALKRIGRIVSLTLQRMLDAAEPGMTTRELDLIGQRLLEEHGARSAPKLTYNFPGSTCIGINEGATHGIPGDRIIRAGDVLNVDVSAELGGYFADTGVTTVVPPTTPQNTRLCRAPKTAPPPSAWPRYPAATITCAWILPATGPSPWRLAMTCAARSVAAWSASASRASISLRSGVPWQ